MRKVLVVVIVLASGVLAARSIPARLRPTGWLLWDVDRVSFAAFPALDELERRGTDAIVAQLIRRLENGHQLHLAIEDSLGAIGQAAVPRLSALLERGTDENRRRAAAALGKTQHADAYAPLARSIASPETPPIVRSWAIGALRLVPGDAAEQLLLQLVQSDDNDTALGAAGSLGDRRSAVALPLMEAVCSKQAEPIARERCLTYMGRVGGPEAERRLAQKLRTEPSAYVRVNIARFLGDTDSSEVAAALDAAAAARQLEVVAGAYPYFLRVSPPVADQLISDAYQRFGSSEMGEAMRASRRPALVAAVDAEARQPVQRPKVIEVR